MSKITGKMIGLGAMAKQSMRVSQTVKCVKQQNKMQAEGTMCKAWGTAIDLWLIKTSQRHVRKDFIAYL